MSANRLLGLRCKGTIKFADVQIFEVKSENGVVSRKKAERCRQEAGVRNQQVKSSIIWVASTISTKKAHCEMRFLSMNYE